MKHVGLPRIQQLVEEGSIAPHGDMRNVRKANCKACGEDLPKGKGFRWIWFWYDGENERATHIFLCGFCNDHLILKGDISD
jgi:hypothetical protein